MVGLLFARCARDRVRTAGPFATPSVWIVLAFTCIVAIPKTLYLYTAHPAWTWLYLLDPEHVPWFMVIPVVLAHGGALVGAWIAGAVAYRNERAHMVPLTAGLLALLLVVSLVLLTNRLTVYGSFQVYEAGSAVGIMDVKLGYSLIAISLGAGLSVVLAAVELVRDARRSRLR